ncbi:MAG: DUF2905 domain-containing protein [Candidatus Acidiferrales bacterium]
MEPAHEFGRGLLIFGLVIAAACAILLGTGKLPFRVGRLPGDISYHGRNSTFYFPVVTCIVISVVLTLLFWLFNSFRK